MAIYADLVKLYHTCCLAIEVHCHSVGCHEWDKQVSFLSLGKYTKFTTESESPNINGT